MNHRQLNLHNIIKQQQSKIAQLKQQLSMVAKITQSSFLDSQKRNIELVVEKDEIIVHLKRELDLERSKNGEHEKIVRQNEELRMKKDEFQEEYNRVKENSIILEKRVRELEYKLQTKVQQYQKKTTLLQRQNKRLSSQLQSLNNTFVLTQNQIDKLTKFYKSSQFDIPKRKQTLLWVDNLIKYMEVSQSSSQKKYAELFEFVEGTLKEMEKEVMKAVSEVAVLEEGLTKDGERVLEEMRKVCEEMKGKELEIGYGIDQLLKTGRKERESAERTQLQTLRTQLQSLQQEHKTSTTSLKSRIKQLQTQKKTLVLGFQQIKTFLQNKQANYKQQIQSLKHTISQLLQANELREMQFEEEIKLLSSQIQSISTRYYENIEYPVMRVNQKVERQLNKVKEELVKLSEENSFRSELLALTQRLKKYGEAMNEEDKEFHAVELCMKKGNQLLITIRQLLTEISEKKSERRSQSRMRNSQHSAINTQTKPIGLLSSHGKVKQPSVQGPSSIPRQAGEISFNQSNVISYQMSYQAEQIQQLKELQSVVSQIQLRQRENKLSYETNLLKKHNQKLTDHLNSLQKKLKQLAGNKLTDEKAMTSYFTTERKLIEVQAQLQQAKQMNVEYEKVLNQEVDKVIKRFDEFRKEYKVASKEEAAISQALTQLTQRHNMIYDMMNARNQRIADLQHSATTINNMLIKPSQTFQSLVKQFTSQLSSLTLIHNQHSSRLGQQHWSSIHQQPSCRSRLSINESTIKEYQEILTKRTQINNSGSRYIVELIKTLRETFPVRDNKRRDEVTVGEKENMMKGQGGHQGKGSTKANNFQKRIKDVIATQQKYKQQITQKLDKILQTLSTLQTKRDKQTKLSSVRQKKIEQLLEKHIPTSINEIRNLMEKETREHVTLNTEALRDTASKLRQSIKENEGLKREMDAILALTKTNASKQENFYEQV